MREYTEDKLVQETAAAFLRDELGWETIYAHDREVFDPSGYYGGTLGRKEPAQALAPKYLREALLRLNPWLSDYPSTEQAVTDAIRLLEGHDRSLGPVERNREKYGLMRDGVPVKLLDRQGRSQERRLKIFDFDQPLNNSFLAVREMRIKRLPFTRRPDLVGLVNGLPLVFMELKNVGKALRLAYDDNLSRYKQQVPQLFDCNGFIILANGVDAKIGSLSSRYEHFYQWKRLAEDEAGSVAMEILLRGVCSPANLIDLFENFILFDDSSGSLRKIIARNHQFLGVNAAVAAVPARKERRGKLGVFWHTQGSGKSYSMVFYAAKIHRKFGRQFTFLICTDRDDLDAQIYNTFVGCGLVDPKDKGCHAQSGADLQELLGQHKACIFTLIQKFNRKISPESVYSQRDDIIVISDEAHRTQYGELAANMRDALPRASFIGFTGTPLFADDSITARIFGEYISTYDFQQAVEDGATVPLHYDARGEKLGVSLGVINKRMAEVMDDMTPSDQAQQARLEKEMARSYHVITAENRLAGIAKDLVYHLADRHGAGKAMLICIDKLTCVRMFDLINAEWERHISRLERQFQLETDEQEISYRSAQLAWMKETRLAPVFSEEPNDISRFEKAGLSLLPHQELMRKGFEEIVDGEKRTMRLDEAFKKRDHPFRLAIVCAMWLTGFDVQSLATLYLDKPLKAHTLMQAIARANRVDEGKSNGFVVDYCGILKELREALARWAGRLDDSGPDDSVPPGIDVAAELAASVNLMQEFLQARGLSLETITASSGFARNQAIIDVKEAVNESDLTRKEFEILARELFRRYRDCQTERDRIRHLIPVRDIIKRIYDCLGQDREEADISVIIHELHKVVDANIKEHFILPAEPPKTFDISRIDFKRLRQEFAQSPRPKTIVQNLKTAVGKRLTRVLGQNPLRVDFQERYEKIVAEYNSEKDRVNIERTFAELLRFIKDLDEETRRAMKEGLDEATLPLFDSLLKDNLSQKDTQQLKKVAAELLLTLKEEFRRVTHWRENASTCDLVRKTIHDFLYDEGTGLPESYNEHEIKEHSEKVYALIYEGYESLPAYN